MSEAELAVFGIGLIDELRGIIESHGGAGAATAFAEAELRGYWEDLEKARKALRN
jgi:hypothetical protein